MSVAAACLDATVAPAALLDAAAAFRSALSEFDPRLLLGPACARVADELAATEKACAAVRLLTAARAVDSGAHHSLGFKDGAAWLATQSGVTNHQAKRDLDTAGRLEEHSATRDALRAGEISKDQAEEIVRAEEASPGVEPELLKFARRSDLSKLRERAREERQKRTPPKDLHAEQHKARTFRHWRDQLGMVCFSGKVTPEVGVPLITHLQHQTSALRREIRASNPEEPLEPWEAHAADAFARMCAPAEEVKRAARTELVIVCDLNAWRRGHTHPGEACHIIGGGPVPVDLARSLGHDAFVKAVLYEGKDIRTVKHFGRYLPAELRTALDLGPVPEFTGRECAECGQKWNLQHDHIDPVGNDGPTCYDNLQSLCWTCHHAKTNRDRDAGLIGRRRGRPPPPRRPPDDP